MNNRFYYLIVLVGCMILNSSCSKEEEGTPLPPTITLEQESPIYQVKVGGTLTIFWNPDNGHVEMCGPATEVFTGEFNV